MAAESWFWGGVEAVEEVLEFFHEEAVVAAEVFPAAGFSDVVREHVGEAEAYGAGEAITDA